MYESEDNHELRVLRKMWIKKYGGEAGKMWKMKGWGEKRKSVMINGE